MKIFDLSIGKFKYLASSPHDCMDAEGRAMQEQLPRRSTGLAIQCHLQYQAAGSPAGMTIPFYDSFTWPLLCAK